MKKMIAAALALLLIAGGAAACTGGTPGTDASETGAMTDTVYPATGESADTSEPTSALPTEDASETESDAGDAQTETDAPEETVPAETETEPVQVRIPDGEPADLTPILRGETAGYDLQYDFAGVDLRTLRADGNLRFSQSSDMTANEAGLSVPSDRWAAVGFSRSMSAPCTVTARVSAETAGDNANVTSAVMLGLRCTDAGHIYTDSGLWIILRDKAVFACLNGDTVPIQLEIGRAHV